MTVDKSQYIKYAQHLPPYEMVYSRERAIALLSSLDKSKFYALDLETTSLIPSEGEVRLTTIWNDDIHFILDHKMCGSFASLVDYIIGPTYIVFNSGFEIRWFDYYASENVTCWDVRLMRCSKMGGNTFNLQRMVKYDLDIMLDKEEQVSDWSAMSLTKKQLDYAAFDGYVTWELFKLWRDEMNSGHWRKFHILNDVVRANIEMEEEGLNLDIQYHLKNIALWERRHGVAKRYFEKFTPTSVIANPKSNQQMSKFLKGELDKETIDNWPQTDKTEELKLDRNVLRQAAFRLPYPMNRWLAAFIIMRFYEKYLSTYGSSLIFIQKSRGAIHTRLNIAAAVTCRYSSSGPNLQNIPRKPYVRRAFVSPPEGNKLMVLADYKGIEVRVLAEVSGDAQLIHDAIYDDVHAVGAATIAKIDPEEFKAVLKDENNKFYSRFKEQRGRAKVFTFRLTYGAGIGTLALSLRTDDAGARKAQEAWAGRYPKAFGYRQFMYETMNRDGFLPLIDGGTIYVPKLDRTIPVAANYPVQGPATSVMYRGIYHTRRLYIERDLDATLACTIHDELLSHASIEDAEEAHTAKLEGMTQGWLDVFPGTDTNRLIESIVGTSWADKP
jgi:DNA polymerase-1